MILFLACINFVNVSIGQSATRVKEIGLRKIVGARRVQLIRQLAFEALLISAGAVLLGCIFAELALPFFNSLALKNLTLWESGQQLPFSHSARSF